MTDVLAALHVTTLWEVYYTIVAEEMEMDHNA